MFSATLICILLTVHYAYAPPVTPEKDDKSNEAALEGYMEYHRYLREVVEALEKDEEFRKLLQNASEDDVRSGNIANQLDFVNHNVRTQLDEIKRRELERLRHLATKQFELDNEIDGHKVNREHLDHTNLNTFEIEDLKKLIKKTTEEIEAADKRRKEEFKEYEMQKEFEKHQKMEAMEEKEKKEYLDKVKVEEEAKKHHEPLHHPGSKQQLEEVWEKQDHMDQQFDPKAFFMMHDVDGNGVWDPNEVKALFIKELDKMYAPNGPNKDLKERAEEMERMREHVFKENDLNQDGLIDFKEFMADTQRPDFNNDEGWKSVDENEIYTQAEYQEFERRRHEDLKYLQQLGLVDAHFQPLPGAQHQIEQALLQLHAYQQQQLQMQMPHYQGQAPMYPPGQMPIQHAPGQYPPPAYQQPQGYQQPIPQYQGQIPPQQNQYQQPPPNQYQQQQQNQYQQPPPNQYQQPQQNQYQQPPQNQYQQPPQNQFQQPQGQGQVAPPPQPPNINQAQPQVPNQGKVPPQQSQIQQEHKPEEQAQQNQIPASDKQGKH